MYNVESQFPSVIGLRKKETAIGVFPLDYLNPEFHKILSRAFWVIEILGFTPYVCRQSKFQRFDL